MSLKKTIILHIQHSRSHALSLLFPSQLSTTSLSTLSICTPIRLSTRPPTRPLLLSSSHGDFPCADPLNVSFDPVPDSTSPTGYEPNNLIEDNSMEIKQMFFHKPSMTSTCDTCESITTPSPKSDLDYDQIRNILTSPLYLQEGEASAGCVQENTKRRSRVIFKELYPLLSCSPHCHLWKL